MLFAVVALVLCVTCANVMNLLIARNTGRAREMSVRLRWERLAGNSSLQSMIETGLLSAIGGRARRPLAIGIVRTRQGAETAGDSAAQRGTVDLPVLAFTYAMVALTAILVGLIPALQSTRPEALRGTGAGTSQNIGVTRIRRLLTIGELAVSVVLLVGALLLGRSLIRLLNTDLGVDVDHVVTASMGLSLNRDLSGAQQVSVVNRMVDDIRTLPGVPPPGSAPSCRRPTAASS